VHPCCDWVVYGCVWLCMGLCMGLCIVKMPYIFKKVRASIKDCSEKFFD
jgi:hypothetical protein